MKWVALLLVITVLDGFLGIVCKVEVPSHASTLNIWPNRIGWFSMVQKGEATKTVYTSIYTGLASLSYYVFVRVCVCVCFNIAKIFYRPSSHVFPKIHKITSILNFDAGTTSGVLICWVQY